MEENAKETKNQTDKDDYILWGIVLIIIIIFTYYSSGLFLVTLILPFLFILTRIKLATENFSSNNIDNSVKKRMKINSLRAIAYFCFGWNFFYWAIGSPFVTSKIGDTIATIIYSGAIFALILFISADIINFFSVILYYDRKIRNLKENLFKVNLQLNNGYIFPLLKETNELDKSSWKAYAFTKDELSLFYTFIPALSWLGVLFIFSTFSFYLFSVLKAKSNEEILSEKLQRNTMLSSNDVREILQQLRSLKGRCGHFVFSDEAVNELNQLGEKNKTN